MYIMAKRKLPRRELPWIGPLLDQLPFSKLPTNHRVLQRLHFEMEKINGTSSLDSAVITVKNELIELWTYAGYGDILQAHPNIIRKIRFLAASYKSLSKTPLSRRSAVAFQRKESVFLATLSQLFDITVESPRYTIYTAHHCRRPGLPPQPLE